MVAAEAILSGRPVLTSRLSNALDVLDAALVEAQPDDPASYVACLRRLIADRALLRRVLPRLPDSPAAILRPRSGTGGGRGSCAAIVAAPRSHANDRRSVADQGQLPVGRLLCRLSRRTGELLLRHRLQGRLGRRRRQKIGRRAQTSDAGRTLRGHHRIGNIPHVGRRQAGGSRRRRVTPRRPAAARRHRLRGRGRGRYDGRRILEAGPIGA